MSEKVAHAYWPLFRTPVSAAKVSEICRFFDTDLTSQEPLISHHSAMKVRISADYPLHIECDYPTLSRLLCIEGPRF